jgi:ParB-like chromosome segregation protein Spo0J
MADAAPAAFGPINIVGYRLVPPDQLLANPKNARRHPVVQRESVRGSLRALGWIAPVLQSVRSGALLDGHLRVEEALSAGVGLVPVCDVDVTPEQEALALAVFDPITNLARYDAEALDHLLAEAQTEEAALGQILADLRTRHLPEARAPRPMPTHWSVIADLPTEDAQAALMQRLQQEGIRCRGLRS